MQILAIRKFMNWVGRSYKHKIGRGQTCIISNPVDEIIVKKINLYSGINSMHPKFLTILTHRNTMLYYKLVVTKNLKAYTYHSGGHYLQIICSSFFFLFFLWVLGMGLGCDPNEGLLFVVQGCRARLGGSRTEILPQIAGS